MASFDIAYRITERSEGGWVNNPSDRGGETYKGVARNFFGGVKSIWNPIDQVKSQLGPQPPYGSKPYKQYAKEMDNRLGRIPALHDAIVGFYKHIFWDKYSLSMINDQKVANRIYDMIVNSGPGSLKIVHRAIGTKESASLSPQHVKVINSIDPNVMLDRLKKGMAARYIAIAEKNPSQMKFLKGWLARLVDNPMDTIKSIFRGGGDPAAKISQVSQQPRMMSFQEEIERTVDYMLKNKG